MLYYTKSLTNAPLFLRVNGILLLMNIIVDSDQAMIELGMKIGALLKGGEVFELIGDVGAGKTTFTKGLAKGLGINEDVQSPTFTISRIYSARDGMELSHYDFYRLSEPGVLKMEIHEAVHNPHMVTIIEWGGIVEGVLPEDRVTMNISTMSENSRSIDLTAGGNKAQAVLEAAE